MVKANTPTAPELVEIVSSRVKAELLRILFGLEHPRIHLRELVRQSGLSVATVQQELRRLARIGLVASTRDGNRVYYAANPAHPLYSTISELVLKTDGLASVLSRALKDDSAVELAFVFGSVARGNASAESDIDIMVIGELGLRRLTKLLSGLSEKVGREINPHVMTPEEFSKRRQGKDHFVSTVLSSPKLFVKGTEIELGTMEE